MFTCRKDDDGLIYLAIKRGKFIHGTSYGSDRFVRYWFNGKVIGMQAADKLNEYWEEYKKANDANVNPSDKVMQKMHAVLVELAEHD